MRTRLSKERGKYLADEDHEEYHKCDNKEKMRFAGSIWVEILELQYRGGKYGYMHFDTQNPL